MNKLFTDRLKELISESGKKQTDISVEMGISKQKLTNWKSGYCEPNIDDIVMIANYFGVTTDFLLGVEK